MATTVASSATSAVDSINATITGPRRVATAACPASFAEVSVLATGIPFPMHLYARGQLRTGPDPHAKVHRTPRRLVPENNTP